MSAPAPPPPMYAPVEPEAPTSYTAIAALIIAIVAIILIIVIVYLVSANQPIITEAAAVWSVTSTGTTFDGAPNSIFQAPSTTSTTALSLGVTPYVNIGTFVVGGSKTTVFKIDNTLSAAPVTITGTVPTEVSGTPTAGTVPAHMVYEYEWTSTTAYKLIGWTK